MKKVLIYFPERKLAPKGGPAGYLYNLRQGLSQMEHSDIGISFYDNAPVALEENQFLRNMIPKRVKDFRRAVKFSKYLERRVPVDKILFDYDLIHFHSTEDMYLNRELLSQYKGKVVLTSHTPCVPYQEIIGRLNPTDYKLFKKKIESLVQIDKYAFERADYIIFPCEEAEEPYFHTWPEYAQIREQSKMRYVPTGIVGCEAKATKEEIRNRYGIPQDAFLISYVGRHNEIKGYSDLLKIGEEVLSKDENTYFIIAGKEGPLYGLKNERWIEVGWTSDPHSIIAASDVFILPNRETYFDLVLLEVISLGVPVIMSRTGGNKYFEEFNTNIFWFYNEPEKVADILSEINDMAMTKDRAIPRKELKTLFEDEFDVSIFSARYIKQYREILKCNSGRLK